MIIKRLRIENLRGIIEKEFDFVPGFNLIVGINGAGKTTILDALRVSISRILRRFGPSKNPPQVFIDDDIRYGANFAETAIDFSLGHSGNFEFRYKRYDEFDSPFSIFTTSQLKTTSSLHPNPDHIHSEVRSGWTLPLAVYYSPSRALPDFSKTKRGAPESGLESARYLALHPLRRLRLQEFYDWWNWRIMEHVQYLQDHGGQGPGRPDILDDIDHAVNSFVDGCSALAPRGDHRKSLFVAKNGLDMDVAQLSEGERGVISIVFDLARRLSAANPELQNPMRDGKAVVLIDEIDLHLHPKWQREVVDFLVSTFPNCQFIATTHSPFIIQSLRPSDQLLVLDGQPIYELWNIGIEQIAKGIMGIQHPEVSEKYIDGVQIAKNYFELLEAADISPPERLEAFKARLATGLGPFAENPAFQAFLEMKRIGKLGS